MARAKKDEEVQDQQAADSGDAGEKAPGEPGDVIDARLQMQEQGDDAVEQTDESKPGVTEELDKDVEAQAQHHNVTGGTAGLAGGPTQDELNPAYSAPTKQE